MSTLIQEFSCLLLREVVYWISMVVVFQIFSHMLKDVGDFHDVPSVKWLSQVASIWSTQNCWSKRDTFEPCTSISESVETSDLLGVAFQHHCCGRYVYQGSWALELRWSASRRQGFTGCYYIVVTCCNKYTNKYIHNYIVIHIIKYQQSWTNKLEMRHINYDIRNYTCNMWAVHIFSQVFSSDLLACSDAVPGRTLGSCGCRSQTPFVESHQSPQRRPDTLKSRKKRKIIIEFFPKQCGHTMGFLR